jgi:hypothetical protein
MMRMAVSAESVGWNDAEASASSDFSASCDCRAEDIDIFPVIGAVLKFVRVERQVFAAYVVIGADHVTPEQAPERFDVVGANLAPNVIICFVVNCAVWKLTHLLVNRSIIARIFAHNLTENPMLALAQGAERRWTNNEL